MIVELEGLQVFPVDDGADGLVLVSWIERYSSSEVRPVPRSMTISRQEANLLADELAGAVDELGRKANLRKSAPLAPQGESVSFAPHGQRRTERFVRAYSDTPIYEDVEIEDKS